MTFSSLTRSAVLSLLAGTLVQAESMADVLARMDRAAGEFRSLSATMKRIHYTAVLNETEETDGTVRLKRLKGSTIGVLEFRQPETRTIFINGKTVQVFYPKANTVEIYDASKYTSSMEQIILLGFGTSSTELKKSYDIKDGGSQKINGTATTGLDLLPKSSELKTLITKIEMWIAEGQSTPLRVKFSEPSKNYEQVDYSDNQTNPALPDSAFELKLPVGVKKIFPQK
ncbi:MAG: outer membrane lipoprotein carrier protein LolA [Bryobacterales bacterium]|nr:outer membrane lipoprotein carrier protein LolA [Bryobacterales bacterium]